MTYTDSTPGGNSRKTQKPANKPKRPSGFPLFAHASKQWAKKIRGKLHYFGSWTDPDAALAKWLAVKDDLLAGRRPRVYDPDALTVGDLGEMFLQSRERRVTTGELSRKTLAGYVWTIRKIVAILGDRTPVEQLRPEDFARLRAELATGVNLKSLEGWIATGRAMFNYGDKNGLLSVPLSRIWGTEFAKPSRTALVKLANKTTRLFTQQEIHTLLGSASVPMRAMILLGANAGFGNTDCGLLEFGHLDLAGGWVSLPRSKTGKPRRCPLWPETVEALEVAVRERPKPKGDTNPELVFITRRGGAWTPCEKDNPVSKEFAKLRTLANVTGRGKSFYTLRHVFQTVGDQTRDFVAVASIMGHSGTSISDNYREGVDDERLQVVVDHVRSWLFGSKKSQKR